MDSSSEDDFVIALLISEDEEVSKKRRGRRQCGFTTFARDDIVTVNITPYLRIYRETRQNFFNIFE